MSFRSILSFVVFCLVALQIAAGQVFRIDARFCNITGVHTVCRGVDPGNATKVEFRFNHAVSVSIVDSPRLSVVPDRFAASFELRLSNTQLERISRKDFRYAGAVKKLDFSNNKITHLPSDVFVDVTELIYLNLSRNNINALPTNVFSSNRFLKEVDVSENYIASLDPNVFAGKPVNFLDVAFNNLTTNLEFLQKMPNLTTLNLSGNCIRQLTASTFVKNRLLQKLILAQACIRTIDYGSFSCGDLAEIDLSYNPLQHIDYGIFINVAGLEKLVLRGSGVDLENVKFLIKTLDLHEIELESDFYRCRDLVEVVSELRNRETKLIVSEPHYETSNINGLKCKNAL